jgi:menaquinone-specific isochorismate synthase
MHQKWYNTTELEVGSVDSKYFYAMETIEVNHLSALAFFAAGEKTYNQKRFYWQNREKTFTLVGLGHAYTITNNEKQTRYKSVEQQWRNLAQNFSQLEGEIQPILFGGFTFDPENDVKGEWSTFPSSYFVVATHQLVIRNDQAFISTYLVADEQISEQRLTQLRKERDELIHAAQVKEVKTYEKPTLVGYTEPYKADYLKSIDQVTSLIKRDEAKKVVIARSLALEFSQSVTSPQILSHVSNEQPESYLFGLEHQDMLFYGASPERLVKVVDGKAYSSCVAGSIKRGATAEEDERLGKGLLNDAKNLGEHNYVVEMITNTFTKNCESVKVPNGPQLLKIRDIQHLFTPVEGVLKENASILQLVESLHPTPALGGVPREQAMNVIRDYEPMNRGLYAAPIGWVDSEGNGEFAVAIRSAALIQNQAYLYAGGGIVADSEAASEYEETLVKFRPMLRALGGKIDDES